MFYVKACYLICYTMLCMLYYVKASFVCSKESDYIARNFINFFILTQTQIFPLKQQTLILTFKKAIKKCADEYSSFSCCSL